MEHAKPVRKRKIFEEAPNAASCDSLFFKRAEKEAADLV
jgi:hypothetical protein